MEKKAKVPKLRFPGFTEDWEQRKLSTIAEFNPKSELPNVFEYVDLESVVGTEMIAHKITKKSEAPSRAQRLAKTGDLFFQTVRPYQKNNYLYEKPNGNYVFSTGYAQMRPNINGYFLLASVQTEQFVKNVLDRCTGTSYPAINSNDLSEIIILVPQNNDESRQIGDCVRNLDNLITLHQRKLTHLQAKKKSLLQKMFPKKGERFPELRFPGFTYAWEQRKLGEVAKFSKGSGYCKDDLVDKGIPIILYGRLYTKYQTKIINVDTFVAEQSNSVYSTGKEVIVPASGETAEDISIASAVMKSGILLGGDLNIVYPYETLNSVFLAVQLSNGNAKKEMSKRAQGKSVVHLHNADLQEAEISIPQIAEQQQIGCFFEQFDNLITLHQRKLAHLQKQKKALLQQMFV
ncbi:MAG: restriction endonuclease subunit S [Selenomonas sp.]|nr:restriction endonuclease subunit S [Selenomonas sp.]